jgi:hypothetical protein
MPRWQMAAHALKHLGAPLAASSARDVFALLARAVPGYAGLEYRTVGAGGRVLPSDPGQIATQEARA